MSDASGWIGVDLDGTLAEWRHGSDISTIGAPIALMVERVKSWLEAGRTVKIFTARGTVPEQTTLIQDWCHEHIGARLEVTCSKDFSVDEIWDDKAVRVEANTGRRII